MTAALRILLLATFLAVCALPTVNMVWALVDQKPLEGVVEARRRPELSLSSVFTEEFQHAFTAWYELYYGARPTLARLDNSVHYHAFQEARPDKLIRVGRNDTLYIAEHLWHWNNRAVFDVTRHARRVKRAQEALRAHGIELAVITIPTKTTLWPEDVPPAWTSELPAPRPSFVNLEQRFPIELRRYGASFVDGPTVLAELGRREREAVYTRTGRHLASPASCLLIDEALRLARPRLPRGTRVGAMDCAYEMRGDVDLLEEEYDLFRLLNVWSPRPAAKAPVVRRVVPETVPLAQRPRTLVVGSSFGWRVLTELHRNHIGSDLQFHYYSNRLIDWPSVHAVDVRVGSPSWRTLMESKDLVVYVVPEEYFADEEQAFFVATIKAFGDPEADADLVR